MERRDRFSLARQSFHIGNSFLMINDLEVFPKGLTADGQAGLQDQLRFAQG